MKLSDGEKLILLMVSDIYEHLGLEWDTGLDPSLIKSAIHEDQMWGLTLQTFLCNRRTRPPA